MSATSIISNFFISLGITLLIVLTPYLITFAITKKEKISPKLAKILTAVFSALSFAITCVIFFYSGQNGVSILPLVLWNTVGYFIIKPKYYVKPDENNNTEILECSDNMQETTSESSDNEQEAISCIDDTVEKETEKHKRIKNVKVKAKTVEKKKRNKPAIILTVTTIAFAISTIVLSICLYDTNIQLEDAVRKNSAYENLIEYKDEDIRKLKSNIEHLYNEISNVYDIGYESGKAGIDSYWEKIKLIAKIKDDYHY